MRLYALLVRIRALGGAMAKPCNFIQGYFIEDELNLSVGSFNHILVTEVLG